MSIEQAAERLRRLEDAPPIDEAWLNPRMDDTPQKTTGTHDPVNSPKHYTFGTIEPIDVIEDWQLGYHEGNVIKYVARHKLKNGLEDLRKARWYLNRLIETLEKEAQ